MRPYSLIVLGLLPFVVCGQEPQPEPPSTDNLPLNQRLGIPNPPVQKRAIAEITAKALLVQSCLPGLGKVLVTSTDRDARHGAAETLYNLGASCVAVLPDMIKALQDKDIGVRRAVLQAIGECEVLAAPAVPNLIRALEDEDQGVRWNAATALSRIGPEAKDAVPALRRAQLSQDQDFVLRVNIALQKITR